MNDFRHVVLRDIDKTPMYPDTLAEYVVLESGDNLQHYLDNLTVEGFTLAGVATPQDSPISGKVFYFASTPGTYANFGNIVVNEREVAVILCTPNVGFEKQTLFTTSAITAQDIVAALGYTPASSADIINLQQQIDAIVGADATVTLSVKSGGSNITNVFAKTNYSLTIEALASRIASSISIKKAGTVINSGENVDSLSASDSINLNGGTNVLYRVDATINGVAKYATKTINAYDKVYWGMGTENDYSQVATDGKVRTSAADTYNFTYNSSRPYVYILVPATMPAPSKFEMGAGGMGDYNTTLITSSGSVEGNPGVTYRVYRGVAAITMNIQLIVK